MSDFSKRIASLTPKQMALLATRLQAKLDASEQAKTEPIAIVGMACRFPGGADDPDRFWERLREGQDLITEIPRERWDADAFYDPDPDAQGKMVTRWGGFIGGVGELDAPFFNISPREAMSMDPQQRLLLEVAWEALEDGGQSADKIAGSKGGVFIGIYTADYSRLLNVDLFCNDIYTSSGNAFSIAANRLSYFFDLQGPSLAIDTACSSSLVAIHFACESLRAGDCNVALAGGVNMILLPHGGIHLSKMRLMSAAGRCKTFDAAADGFVRGEGAGIVVLKRLSDALAQKDPIHAVIPGSACNQDGRTNGLTAPNGLSQQVVVSQALKNAKVQPSQISYIEAHGTATQLGDPIELESLAAVFSDGGPDTERCVVGSVKTNMGHLEAAAGVAGVIKVALSLEHEQIPPHLHFKQLSPHIDLQGSRLEISTQGQAWPRGETKRIAGVSSFGFGGTNAHVVVEEAPAAVLETESGVEEEKAAYALPVSARAGDALRELAQRYVKYLGEEETRVRVKDLCYTAGVRRAHHPHRLCVVGHDYQELQGGLQSYVAEEAAVGVYSGRKSVGQRPKVAFIFPGQGSQWLGMGRELLQREAVFRRKLEECEAAMRPYQQWSLIEELQEGKEDGEQQRIDVVQPQLFALQVGLAELWRSWGVEPDAVVGHSMGEVAAACVSGVLSLEAGAQVICQRSQLLRRLSGRGAMAVVELSAGAVAGALGSEGGLVSVAAVNSWRTTVISGERAAIKRLVEKFGNENIYSREVKVDVASHSREVEEIGGELREQLAGLRGRRGAVAMYSTVTGAELKGEEVDGEYWVRNVREEVRFAAVLEELKRRGYGVYVEVSAHPVLLPAIEEVVRGAEENGAGGAVVVGTLRKELSERQALLESVGQLYASGVEVDWEPVNGVGRCVKLPSYPWQHRKYWVKQTTSATERKWRAMSATGHPLLGRRFQTATDARQHFWELGLDLARVSYLKDHRVNGVVVLPATAYIEMALAGAEEAFGSTGSYELEEVAFEKMLILSEDDQDQPVIQLVIEEQESGQGSFQIFSQTEKAGWMRHAAGKIRVVDAVETAAEVVSEEQPSLAEIEQRCVQQINPAYYYDAMAEARIEYGESFQILDQMSRCDGESLARLRLTENEAKRANVYQAHPVILDGAIQMIIPALPQNEITPDKQAEIYVPVKIGKVIVRGKVDGSQTLWARAVVERSSETASNDGPSETASTLRASVYLLDESARPLIEIHELQVKAVKGRRQLEIEDWFYRISWQAMPVLQSEDTERESSQDESVSERYLILADRQGVGEQLAEQLRAAELEPVLVYAGEKYEQQSATVYEVDPLAAEDLARVLQTVGAADLRIVHLWSLDVQSAACSSAAELLAWQQRSCGSVLHLVQALGRSESATEQRLWVVTSGAQALGETGEIEAAQAAVWGLGRVVGHEQPQQWGGLIDLDGGSSAAESAAQLVKELRGQGDAGAENEVGYRGGERYVPRLVRARSAEPEAATPLQISGAGSYLITGGMGGLGLEVGKWLVSQGARHVVLLGRSGPKESATEALETMQAAGAMVECVQADVADASRMREVMEGIEQAGKELRGVIHAAGVLDDGVLSGQTWERFEGVMNSKVLGAWNLAELTREKELDFFVLFSSGASILGSPGQGNYAAANAYLDSLAAARQRRGEVGLSINWGAWAEVGLVTREDRARLVASRGMQSMKPADALMALGQVIQQRQQGQMAIMATDWDQLMAYFPEWATPRILLEITKEKKRQAAQWQQFRRQLEAAPVEQRRDLIVDHIKSVIVQALRINSSEGIEVDKNLLELGMDSLIGLEVRNKLEASLGVRLSAKLLWDYPTIDQLATHLASVVIPSAETGTDHASNGDPETAANEQQLSADQTKALSTLLEEIESISK